MGVQLGLQSGSTRGVRSGLGHRPPGSRPPRWAVHPSGVGPPSIGQAMNNPVRDAEGAPIVRYVFATAHQVLGIAHKDDDPDITLFRGQDPETRVFITRRLDDHWRILDRHSALVSMLGRGLLGQAVSADVSRDLQREIEALRQRRAKSLARDGILVIEICGDVAAVVREPLQRIDDFVLCFDAVDKKALSGVLEARIASILAAVRIGGGRPYELNRVAAGSYLVAADGKVIHSVSFEAGAVTAYPSSPVGDSEAQRIHEDINLVLQDQQLARPIQLFARSLDRDMDALRTFLSAWSAMEIMIGKIFPSYQARVMAELVNISAPPGLAHYVKRIAEVMQSKHTLSDKFAVVSNFLDEEKDSGDIARFRSIKKIRDRLSHGADVSDASLPNRELQTLFEKYLRNHLRRRL
jgi:hypothetical protein